ncbi:MAG TPA: hypothetical protein VFB22_10370 [Candidatus Baltobacteraceae bacterium]|nr:hypothetical protein [Candidatus Baltobacteraceae bacterium]
MSRLIHDVRNHLAVAVANVEAFRDRILEPTPERLETVLRALAAADQLLADARAPEDRSTAEAP